MREDQPESALRRGFEQLECEAAGKAVEHRRAEREQLGDEIDDLVVVQQREAGQLRQLLPDRHLADGGGTEDEDQPWS